MFTVFYYAILTDTAWRLCHSHPGSQHRHLVCISNRSNSVELKSTYYKKNYTNRNMFVTCCSNLASPQVCFMKTEVLFTHNTHLNRPMPSGIRVITHNVYLKCRPTTKKHNATKNYVLNDIYITLNVV